MPDVLGLLLLLSHFSHVRLCNPIDGSPPGSAIPGILQARTLEWVAISFSNAWKWKVKVKSLSRVRLFRTPWTDCSLPGFSVHGILQARVLEWGAIACSSRSFQSRDRICTSCIDRWILYLRSHQMLQVLNKPLLEEGETLSATKVSIDSAWSIGTITETDPTSLSSFRVTEREPCHTVFSEYQLHFRCHL